MSESSQVPLSFLVCLRAFCLFSVFCSETGSYYVDEAGLKLMQIGFPPECSG